MKHFIIINGKRVLYIAARTLKAAEITAENNCDHSKEIIVREIENVNLNL